MKEQEWIVERHDAFAFRGPSGNPAIADRAIVTRDDSVPVVVASELDDNPGISVTNGAEHLATQILTELFPERIGHEQPFRLVEHYPAISFDPLDLKEVQFTDYQLRPEGASTRIGEPRSKILDARVAKVLAEQTMVQWMEPEEPRRRGISDADLSAAIERHREREHVQQQDIEATKKSRGMRR